MFAGQHRGVAPAVPPRSYLTGSLHVTQELPTVPFRTHCATAEFAGTYCCRMESPPTQCPRARPATLAALAADSSRYRAHWRADAAVRRVVSAAARHCAGGFSVSAREHSGGDGRVPVRCRACCAAWAGGMAGGNPAPNATAAAHPGWPCRWDNDCQCAADRHRCRNGEAACFDLPWLLASAAIQLCAARIAGHRLRNALLVLGSALQFIAVALLALHAAR